MDEQYILAYLAGTSDDDNFKSKETELLLEIEDLDVYDSTITFEDNELSDEQSFAEDSSVLLESNTVLFDSNDKSEKALIELGQVWGINFIVRTLTEIAKEAIKESEVQGVDIKTLVAEASMVIIRDIPTKTVHQYNSGDQELPNSSYLQGILDNISGEPQELGDIIEKLKEDVEEVMDFYEGRGDDEQ